MHEPEGPSSLEGEGHVALHQQVVAAVLQLQVIIVGGAVHDIHDTPARQVVHQVEAAGVSHGAVDGLHRGVDGLPHP